MCIWRFNSVEIQWKIRETAFKIAVQCSIHAFNINGVNEFVTKLKKDFKTSELTVNVFEEIKIREIKTLKFITETRKNTLVSVVIYKYQLDKVW